MVRSLTSAMISEVQASVLSPIFLVQFSFSTPLRFWTGFGDLKFGGNTYMGAGNLLTISPIEETQEVRSTGVNFALSGIPSSILSVALTEDYQGRDVRMWFAVLDANKDIVLDPYLAFVGRMDVMEIVEQGETSAIGVSAENVLVALERPNERRYTPEDQKISFSGDKGFDFVAQLQDKQLIWGRS